MSQSTIDPRELARHLVRHSAARPTIRSEPELPTHPPDLRDHPGYSIIKEQERLLDELGVENPYFQPYAARDGARLHVNGEWRVNYSSFNYLGLATDPDVAAAAKAAIDQYGTSVSAARIVSGEVPIYAELERELATVVGCEAAMVFVSGFTTNVVTIGYLFDENDLVVHDQLIHNSMVTGTRLAAAKRVSFAHNDPDSLQQMLSRHRRGHRRAIVLLEGVYSMDGDIARAPELVRVAREYDALVMVDEAHALGTLGDTGLGVHQHYGMPPADVDIWMGTLSKSLGSCGGYICGSSALVDNLRYNAPGAALYATGMAPATAAAALAGLRKLLAEPSRVWRLRGLAERFLRRARAAGLNTGWSGGTPIIPVVTGSSVVAVKLADRLQRRGINVQAILHPAVAEDAARLRFFITADHKEDDIDEAVEATAAELELVAGG